MKWHHKDTYYRAGFGVDVLSNGQAELHVAAETFDDSVSRQALALDLLNKGEKFDLLDKRGNYDRLKEAADVLVDVIAEM